MSISLSFWFYLSDHSILFSRGRALSFQLLNGPNGGINYTFSSISMDPSFQQGQYPMPLIVSDDRYAHETVVGSNSTVYEFNPWEFGTWDPTIYGFAPLEYIGSNFSNGIIPENEGCVRGLDNAGFIMGTSSTLFNEPFIVANSSNIPGPLKTPILSVLGDIGSDMDDVSIWTANPFRGYNNASNPNRDEWALNLVDGGEDLQNIPLQPLIQPHRAVDVIFAIDSSADTGGWPDGASLVQTYERSLNASGIGNHTAFPAIPDTATFINNGLNKRPTFFGCDSHNTSSITPLIVYLPNAPYSSLAANTSTFQDTYSSSTRDAVIQNGYNVVTMGNNSIDPTWTSCVGCAILSRSFERTGTAVPHTCSQCFTNFCWNGSLNTSIENPVYQPTLITPQAAAGSIQTPRNLIALAVAAAAVFAIM